MDCNGDSPEEQLGAYLRYLEKSVPSLTFLSQGETVPTLGAVQEIATEPDLSDSVLPSGSSPVPMNGEMEDLRKRALVCQMCALALTRQNVVFGEGSRHSGLMFVGEGPGADEDRTGRPFVGRAGELLTKMIQAMGLSREDVYIANTVKCRPPGNRVPSPEEREACSPFLNDQIRLLKPRYMVLLGQTATQALLHRAEGISKLRGQEFRLDKFPEIQVLPTYHPAYLLRNPQAKKDVWEDLKTVMGWMGIPLPKGSGAS
ncbi:MAG: uracil-DNA glycosylase [Leptospirales bacterium]